MDGTMNELLITQCPADPGRFGSGRGCEIAATTPAVPSRLDALTNDQAAAETALILGMVQHATKGESERKRLQLLLQDGSHGPVAVDHATEDEVRLG